MKVQALFMALCLAATTTGCAAGKRDATTSQPPTAASFVESELVKAANRTSERMERLVAVTERIQGPPPSARAVPPSSGPLAREITVSWNDSVDRVLEKIIHELPGWKLRVTGKPPVEPLIVNVQGRKSIFAVLEDIGWQTGNRAIVQVSGSARQILLAWQGMVEPYEQLRNAGQNIPWNGERNTLIGGIRRNLPKGWTYTSDPVVRNLYVKTYTDKKNWRRAMTEFAGSVGAKITFDDSKKRIIVGR